MKPLETVYLSNPSVKWASCCCGNECLKYHCVGDKLACYFLQPKPFWLNKTYSKSKLEVIFCLKVQISLLNNHIFKTNINRINLSHTFLMYFVSWLTYNWFKDCAEQNKVRTWDAAAKMNGSVLIFISLECADSKYCQGQSS